MEGSAHPLAPGAGCDSSVIVVPFIHPNFINASWIVENTPAREDGANRSRALC